MLEPWQVLIEIGHYCTYNYPYLLKVLEEFKDMNELRMAKNIASFVLKSYWKQKINSLELFTILLKLVRKATLLVLIKSQMTRKTSMTWSIDNLARAFRELYSNLNW